MLQCAGFSPVHRADEQIEIIEHQMFGQSPRTRTAYNPKALPPQRPDQAQNIVDVLLPALFRWRSGNTRAFPQFENMLAGLTAYLLRFMKRP